MLKLSSDRKVSPQSHLKGDGKTWVPDVPNSFGLTAGLSCPGATEACKSVCYAARTERVFTSAGRLVNSNLEALQAAATVDAMAELLADMVDRYRTAHAKAERKHGKAIPMVFRIHWDGDFYSVDYAMAWRRVILSNADVQFWAYTRSFVDTCNVVPTLADVPNLALYLSVDTDNGELAATIAAQFPNVKLAVMAPSFEAAQAVTVTIRNRRAPLCPENAQRTPLVNGSGEGACVTCGLCVNGKRDVLFSTSHK